MRGALGLVLVLAACAPDIVPGAYACGPQVACPKGLACDGPTATCVLPSTAQVFACDPQVEHEPDDTPAQALALPGLSCTSSPVVDDGCLAAGDGQNWVSFTAPAACAGVALQSTVSYPIAFEPIGLELWELGGMTQVATDQACTTPDVGTTSDERCLTATLVPGDSYGVKVMPAGGGDCGGHCNFNRYELTVQLRAP